MSESVADAPEMTEAEAVVQAQIKAYNSHDLESFLAFYAEAVQIYDGNAVLLRDGREALREEYTKRFARTELNVELLGRLTVGEWVYDKEIVTGVKERPVVSMTAYRVRNGLIDTVRMHK